MGMKKWLSIGLAAMMSISLFTAGVSADVRGANEDAANETTTDENITIGLASEPSVIWGAPTAKTEKSRRCLTFTGSGIPVPAI